MVVVSDLDRHLGFKSPSDALAATLSCEVITCRLHRRVYSSRLGKETWANLKNWKMKVEMIEIYRTDTANTGSYPTLWRYHLKVLCMIKSSMHSILQHRPHGAPRVRMVRGSHVSPCPLSCSFHLAVAAGMITTNYNHYGSVCTLPLPSQRNHEMSWFCC